ncbi:MAG: hypothetical protein GEU80_10970 [Dehalococcoidia bacterium]|nr:hypothetical protein [Dehalococcoidia bacterium]
MATVVAGEPRDLPVPVEVTAFRVLQEALTNVVKHSRAHSAQVTVGYEADGVSLQVADDGRGTPPGAGEGFGMTGMRERIDALGGRFEAVAASPSGFVVRAWLPAPVDA